MTRTPITKEIPIPFGGVLHLAATPLSSFELTSPVTLLNQATNKLTLEGTCSFVPDNTPCELLLTRKPDATVPHPPFEQLANDAVALRGLMRVQGSSFKILKDKPGATDNDRIELGVVSQELVGKGNLVITVVPELPGCNLGAPAQERIFPYDNQIEFSAKSGTAPLMGTDFAFEPTRVTGAFQDIDLRLAIEEYDDPKSLEGMDASLAGKDLHKELEWPKQDRAARHWRVGCDELKPAKPGESAKVRLAYPEPDEVPPYEFGYRIEANLGGKWQRLGYPIQLFAPSVPQPAIRILQLELIEGGHESAAPGGAIDATTGSTRNQIKVTLGLSGFASDVSFAVSLRVWRAEGEGDQRKIRPAGFPALEETYDASVGDNVYLRDTTQSDLTNCFVVLSFPSVAGMGAAGTHVPITEVLEIKANPGEGNLAFEEPKIGEGKLVDPRPHPHAAIGVACSRANQFLQLKSEVEDDIETLAMAMCIYTEARDNPDLATRRLEMKHVGGVIQNRAQNHFRSQSTIFDTVLFPKAFSYFNEEGTAAKIALKSKDPAQVRAWRRKLDETDGARFDECLEVSRGLVDDPSSNPFASIPGGDRVYHYYSPQAMNGKVPDWALLKPGTCDADAAEVTIPTISKNRFRWYKGVH